MACVGAAIRPVRLCCDFDGSTTARGCLLPYVFPPTSHGSLLTRFRCCRSSRASSPNSASHILKTQGLESSVYVSEYAHVRAAGSPDPRKASSHHQRCQCFEVPTPPPTMIPSPSPHSRSSSRQPPKACSPVRHLIAPHSADEISSLAALQEVSVREEQGIAGKPGIAGAVGFG